MISIDEEVHNKIKEKGLNVSAEVERALKNKLYGQTKEYVPEEAKVVKCCQCGSIENEGYYCSESKRNWCKECHLKLDIIKQCRPYYKERWTRGQGREISHEHIYWRDDFGHRPIAEEGFIGLKDKYHENRNEKLMDSEYVNRNSL